jgi:flagellar M-ring protein FliF
LPQQIQTLIDNLGELGQKRLLLVGGIGALVVAMIVTGAIYLNKPAYETLYVGLERNDVAQMGAVLTEAGVNFDISSDGTSVLVPAGSTGTARMLLAERGLPTSSNAGYELFDNVGSFGLTSFMQQITRVRALEGEIARTIQSISGIKGARVHLVMPERASFRRDEQPPSASVVIRSAGIDALKTAQSIRHMVAAAVPGLSADKVTVLDAAGELLATGDDPSNNSVSRAIGVERSIEMQIEENIRRALTPYLGHENFRASVRAQVNTDSRQTEETIFDPDSRVERSVQVVRSNDQASQRQAAPAATVQQNLPEEAPGPGEGPESTEQRERREETTNYELNSKRIATVSNGYALERLTIAVVVNSERLAAVMGSAATPEMAQARIDEIRALVASATGFDEVRGDLINVSSVEFVEGLDGQALEQPGMFDSVGRHAGTMINALAFIVVAFLVSWFGLRPMATALLKPASKQEPSFDEIQLALPAGGDALALPAAGETGSLGFAEMAEGEFKLKLKPAPQDRLAQMVDMNEERSALILRKWASLEAA